MPEPTIPPTNDVEPPATGSTWRTTVREFFEKMCADLDLTASDLAQAGLQSLVELGHQGERE